MHARKEKPSPEALLALFMTDSLVPIRALFSIYSQSTFYKWRREGLPVYCVPGTGNCVKPTELKKFMEALARKEAEAA